MIKQSEWAPRPGWLMLIPTQLPDETEGGIILPETFKQKSTSGTVIKCGYEADKEIFLGMEVFFPKHNEHQVVDSDNQQLYYFVQVEQVISMRKPPKQEPTFKVQGA